MLRLSSAGVGLAAMAVAIGGALHIEQAAGSGNRNLSVMLQDYGLALQQQMPSARVNRDGKADRAALPQGTAAAYRTVSLSLAGLPDTSVIVRMPLASGEILPARALPPDNSGATRRLIACEPIASILTEAGRSGVTGRCVT